jgi:hypothetical protein
VRRDIGVRADRDASPGWGWAGAHRGRGPADVSPGSRPTGAD